MTAKRQAMEPNKDYCASVNKASIDLDNSQCQTTQVSMLEQQTEARQMSMMERNVNISAWDNTNNGRSSDMAHDSLMDESERMLSGGSPVAQGKKRRNGDWSRLSNKNNRMIKVQDNNKKRMTADGIEVNQQKFVKSSIAWYSINDSQKHSNEPIKQGYRNSIDFRSLEPMESRFESDSQAMAKPSTTDNSVITREQRRKNYKNINDYLQLANLD